MRIQKRNANRNRIWLVGLLIAVAVVSFVVVVAVGRYVSDRQTATIGDIPAYPGAELLAQSGSAPHGSDDCSTLLYKAFAGEDAVQEFYKETLLHNQDIAKRDWVGDGVFYPQTHSVNFYRKAGGLIQILNVNTSHQEGWTHLKLNLCSDY